MFDFLGIATRFTGYSVPHLSADDDGVGSIRGA